MVFFICIIILLSTNNFGFIVYILVPDMGFHNFWLWAHVLEMINSAIILAAFQNYPLFSNYKSCPLSLLLSVPGVPLWGSFGNTVNHGQQLILPSWHHFFFFFKERGHLNYIILKAFPFVLFLLAKLFYSIPYIIYISCHQDHDNKLRESNTRRLLQKLRVGYAGR